MHEPVPRDGDDRHQDDRFLIAACHLSPQCKQSQLHADVPVGGETAFRRGLILIDNERQQNTPSALLH
jgi:hypothetical protein